MNATTSADGSLSVEPTIDFILQERPIIGKAISYMDYHSTIHISEENGILTISNTAGLEIGRLMMIQYPSMNAPRLFVVNQANNPAQAHPDDRICDFNASKDLLTTFLENSRIRVDEEYVLGALENILDNYKYEDEFEKSSRDQRFDRCIGNFKTGYKHLDDVIHFCVENDYTLDRIPERDDDENYVFSVLSKDGSEVGYFFNHSDPTGMALDQVAFRLSGDNSKRKIHAGSMISSIIQAEIEREGYPEIGSGAQNVIETIAGSVHLGILTQSSETTFDLDGHTYSTRLIRGENGLNLLVQPVSAYTKFPNTRIIITATDTEYYIGADGKTDETDDLLKFRDAALDAIRSLEPPSVA